MEVLRAGGNAFDAAVAVSAALAVVEPTGSGLTGGGIYLLHRQSDGVEMAIDAREFAPARGHARHVPRRAGPAGARACRPTARWPPASRANPPVWRCWRRATDDCPWRARLAPAIHLARAGFPLSTHLHDALVAQLEQFKSEPDVAQNFLRQRRGAADRHARAPAAARCHAGVPGPARARELSTTVNWPPSWWPACARRAASGPRRILRPTARSNARPSSASTAARASSRRRRPARAASG